MTVDVLYFAHFIITFCVGYIQEGTLITSRKSIRNKYLSREFCFDIISALPLDTAELFLEISRAISVIFFKSMRDYGESCDFTQ